MFHNIIIICDCTTCKFDFWFSNGKLFNGASLSYRFRRFKLLSIDTNIIKIYCIILWLFKSPYKSLVILVVIRSSSVNWFLNLAHIIFFNRGVLIGFRAHVSQRWRCSSWCIPIISHRIAIWWLDCLTTCFYQDVRVLNSPPNWLL